jgi:hypothetical protein
MAEAPKVTEIALCAAWHSGAATTLQTVSGETIEIVHRGAWTHGLGPDFRDALILFAGRELRAGSIEIHHRTRGWTDHHHHLDPAYNSVILHLVAHHDGSQTRRQDGAIVPVAELGALRELSGSELARWDWDRVGGTCCAEDVARARPRDLSEHLFRLGDTRLAARAARLEGRLPTEPAGEMVWSEILDGLGFTSNREPMRDLARRVPLASLEALLQAVPGDDRAVTAMGVLLGAGGFLPLSPQEAHLGKLSVDTVGRLEDAWRQRGNPWHLDPMLASAWNLARVRPSNHPVPRLLAAANLLTAASGNGGLLTTILGILHDVDPVVRLTGLTADRQKMALLGPDRAIDILASGIIPLALALAAHTGDTNLADAASRQWERLPAPASNVVTRRAMRQVAGRARLGKIGARGAQGLLHLDTTLCQTRRCFECPIAVLALSSGS